MTLEERESKCVGEPRYDLPDKDKNQYGTVYCWDVRPFIGLEQCMKVAIAERHQRDDLSKRRHL